MKLFTKEKLKNLQIVYLFVIADSLPINHLTGLCHLKFFRHYKGKHIKLKWHCNGKKT